LGDSLLTATLFLTTDPFPVSALIRKINYLHIWRGHQRVWGAEIYHPSYDRWLYLFLHRWGGMGRLERKVIETLIRPGMSVLDVGANIGLYSALFSKCVGPQGKVTALEPVPDLYQALLRTLQLNHLANVEAYAYAAGAEEGTVDLALDAFNSGNNWITPSSGRNGAITAPVRRIDSLNLDRAPDFIKIDVQGWEVEVLRGLSGLLASNPAPAIFCEISLASLKAAGSSARELGQFLLDYRYEIKLPLLREGELEFVPLDLAALEQKAVSTFYFDILAAPR